MNSQSEGREWGSRWPIFTEGAVWGSRSFKEFRVHYNQACVAWPVWSKGCIPESPGHETQLTAGCPGRAQVQEPWQRQEPQPQPGADKQAHERGASELWKELPRGPSSALPGIRQEGRGTGKCQSPGCSPPSGSQRTPETLTVGGQGQNEGGLPAFRLGLLCCPACTQPLLSLCGDFSCSPSILKVKHRMIR